MKQTRYGLGPLAIALFIMIGLGVSLLSVHAQDNPNTITFDNRSGEPALVKLIGPTGQTVEVPDGESRTVNVAAGEYYILVRYGNKPEQYNYTKGDPFTVQQTGTQYSVITITLHKVVGGNYPTRPTSVEEFDSALGGTQGTLKDRRYRFESTNKVNFPSASFQVESALMEGKIKLLVTTSSITRLPSNLKPIGFALETKGSKDIDILINKEAGYTYFAGLHFFDPTKVSIWEDGTVEVD
jgi:hypothetical protein